MTLSGWHFHLSAILLITYTYSELCFGAKLERKQDYFDVDSFDSKRDYRLNEIGKRGFSPAALGFDYPGSSEYGIGATSAVSSDFGGSRSGGNDETLSPARDLIPPPAAPGLYSSSKPPPTSKSRYPKFARISYPSSTSKAFHSAQQRGRSQISRRSPHLQQTSLNSYFDEISSSTTGSHGRALSSGNFGLVADNDGKLIGYRGSILPGYADSSQAIVTSSTSSIAPDPSNFVGSYYPGVPSPVPVSDYVKPKYGLASSASSGSYTSTPVYYPGREEDHTYRMRDATSQGYEDEESNPSFEDNDFPVRGSTYQPSPLSPPPSHHYHSLRESDGFGHSRHLETNRFLGYGRNESPGSGFSYGPVGKSHTSSNSAYGTKRAYGPSSASNYGIYEGGSRSSERVIPYSYTPLSYGDYTSN